MSNSSNSHPLLSIAAILGLVVLLCGGLDLSARWQAEQAATAKTPARDRAESSEPNAPASPAPTGRAAPAASGDAGQRESAQARRGENPLSSLFSVPVALHKIYGLCRVNGTWPLLRQRARAEACLQDSTLTEEQRSAFRREIGMVDGILNPPGSKAGVIWKACSFLGPAEVPETLLERERAAYGDRPPPCTPDGR